MHTLGIARHFAGNQTATCMLLQPYYASCCNRNTGVVATTSRIFVASTTHVNTTPRQKQSLQKKKNTGTKIPTAELTAPRRDRNYE